MLKGLHMQVAISGTLEPRKYQLLLHLLQGPLLKWYV